MKIGQKSLSTYTFAVLSSSLLCCIIYIFFHQSALIEPDRYYHFFISQQMTEKGFLHTVPQVVGLHWQQYFSDKEFLYHLYTALAYFINGEKGIILAQYFLVFSIFFSLFLLLQRIVQNRYLSAICLLSLPFIYFSMQRFALIRPHIFAILLFLFFLHAFLAKRPYLSATFLLLYALAYHAIYIPIFFLIAFWFSSKNSHEFSKATIYSFLGILAGTIIYPYFPTNIYYMLEALIVSLKTTNQLALHYGMEVQQDNLIGFIQKNLFIITILLSATALRMTTPEYFKKSALASTSFNISIIFFCFSILSPRVIEYGFIFYCLLLAYTAAIFLDPKKNIIQIGITNIAVKKVIATLLCLGIISQAFSLYSPYSAAKAKGKALQQESNYILQAMESLPKGQNINIFHCGWAIAPYIIYKRNNARIMDLLSPTYLYSRNKDWYFWRRKILDGLDPNMYRTIKEKFQADYIVCREPRKAIAIADHPKIKQIFPKQASNHPLRIFHLE